MITTVRLDPKTLTLMERLARRTRRTKSQVIRDAIAHLSAAEAEPTPAGSAYEALQPGIGCWDSGGAELSRRTGEQVKRMLLARRNTDRRRASRTSRPGPSRGKTS